MARAVKEEQYAVRRNEILDVAQRLIFTQGYEQTSIQHLLDELGISKGAFYHYFSSKQALLEALIERMVEEAQQVIDPILNDSNLPPLEKLEVYFSTLARWKTAQKAYLMALLYAWYSDDNLVVRQKMQTRILAEFTPMLTGVIQQGIQQGVFASPFPNQVGEVVLSLMQNLGDALARMLMTPEASQNTLQAFQDTLAAYTDALERVLGAPSNSLHLFDLETLKEWIPPPTPTRSP
ncbi:MAG: TetR/AcrR family transcriptional regulator [Chloroflexota bacterium]